MVDIKLVKEFKKPVTLDEIKANPKLKNMKLIQTRTRDYQFSQLQKMSGMKF